MSINEILLILAIVLFLGAAFISYGRNKVFDLIALGLAALTAAFLLGGRAF